MSNRQAMRPWALALLLAAPLCFAAGQVQAEKRITPDFSSVRSLAAANRLAAQGRLVKVLLFPAELGGQDVPENVSYIPPEADEARRSVIGVIRRMMQEGKVNRMTVTPTYKGDSFVPATIQFKASHSRKGGSFEPTIEVW